MAQCMRFGRITGGPAGRHAVLLFFFSFHSASLSFLTFLLARRVVAGALTLAVRLNTLEAWADNKMKNKTQGNGLFER